MSTKERVPQEERTRAMRGRLLEACVECLVEVGFAKTSTTLVSQRAGVSRGAQLHHFPTKNALVVAAVEHVAQVRGDEIRHAIGQLPTGEGRTRALLEVVAEHYTSDIFTAALELWVAARTDPELLAALGPLERNVGREMHQLAVAALAADESIPGVRELVQGTLDMLRGLALADTISNDALRRRSILDVWAQNLDVALAHGTEESL